MRPKIEEVLDVTGSGFDFSSNSHILRRHARQYLSEGLNRAITQFELRPLVDTRANAVAGAVERLMGYGDFPIMRPLAHRYLPGNTFSPALGSLIAGGITAAQAANQIQSSIADFFAAEAMEIVAYVPAPVLIREGPPKTLRVMTPNDHTGVLEQAAELINASWHARDIPYVFVLEVDDWPWTAREGDEARMARLGVELMAGGGPDMFLILENEQELVNVTDVRSFAERGFLADINTLIENHPTTNRSDFHENILDALEIDGGLYIFPVSFGFYRAGINTAIPQPFVERFMAYESITFGGLLDFYLEFMEIHGHEYGHLVPGTPITMGWQFQHVVKNSIGPFIDFNRRTSNLNSPEFADLLTFLTHAFERNVFIANGWVMGFPSASFLRDRQQELLFISNTLRNMPAEAFLARPQPFFANYIPITDDFGNLLFNLNDSQTWGTWAITAAGDSELAWEFMTYMLLAYYAPKGRAAVDPVFGQDAVWANNSIATPIKRAHFESKTRRALEFASYVTRGGRKHAQGSPEWEQEIEDAIRTIAAQNAMPVVHVNPLFPPFVVAFLEEPLEQLRLGLITAETAAQRIHNSITLWLLE